MEAEAKERQRIGQKEGGKIGGRGRPNSSSTNSYESYSDDDKPARKEPGNVNAQIGLAVGVGAGTGEGPPRRAH